MNLSMFFRVGVLMLLAGLMTMLFWWNLWGPAWTLLGAITLTLFSLFEDASR